MAEYQVIARKWRPQCFADVVGQEHVVRTLKNAIRQNRTAHAYLFVGPRGVGKTTLARIFAKAMNCETPRDGEPCCQCRSCRMVAEERSLDVIEIDAASRNSAGDMRELAEEVVLTPVAGRYRIYIIDEVHMLSKQAWNALLKTVEEPPPHVKFIFATTEVHQVLPTIISRCQRFDLLPIPTRLIAARLALIAETEKVKIEPEAINAIARAAEGGMRDAQSLLDQMIAFFAQEDDRAITGAQVLSLFGLTDRADLEAILQAMMGNRPDVVVAVIHALARKGKNLETLFDDLLAALRGVRIALVLRNPSDILEEDAETIERYRQLAAAAPPDTVPIMLEQLAPVGRVLHDALNKQVYLETILLKAMREAHAVRLDDVLARLNQLRTAGELKFLDRLPPPVRAAAPAPLPAPLPTPTPAPAAVESPAAPAPAPVAPVAPVPPPEPVKPVAEVPPPVEAAVPVESVAPEEVPPAAEPAAGVEPAMTGEAVLAALTRAAAGLATAPIFRTGTLESYRESVLTLGFGVQISEEDFARLHAELPSYQKLMQEVTGDWAGNVEFRRFTQLEPVPVEVPEPAPAAPADETAGPDVESAVPSDPPPVAVPAAEWEPDAEDESEPEATEATEPLSAAAPAVDGAAAGMVDDMILPEFAEFARQAKVEALTESAAEPVSHGPRRVSIANDQPAALQSARERPAVRDILELFGGDVVDIHVVK